MAVLVPVKPKTSKAERREKQRATNVLRAEKMHKARLDMLRELVPEAPALPTLNVGCSGWFYWDWKGTFYPEDMKTNEWFAYYMQHFGTVELNAPFYGWPTVNTVKTWRRQAEANPDFVYTVKVNELITHIWKFEDVGELITSFGLIADVLGPKFGCFLYQLPPSYHFSEQRLEDILSQLDHSRRNVVEFRHASWWNDRVYAAFETTGTIFCACSGPKLPDDMVKTADEVYVRFHGTEKWYRHNYSDEELEAWAQKIVASKPARTWVYFNNDYDGYAIANGLWLRERLKV
ncbi:MAG: DUF72 domain-containing protein [Blastochloris viridis]|uniref:DUF72 domain-containing protein n=1 Tax=Blastochloris viridis TaxID=1079 RepID=A0A6N4REC5_BLAVI|nr:MAG: DUF72 domain-containing protein [Blastochloris viridis]